MIPQYLARLFGTNWKTTLCGLVFLVAGFVASTPDLFSRWPIVLAAAKYLSLGAGGAGLLAAMDMRKPPPAPPQ